MSLVYRGVEKVLCSYFNLSSDDINNESKLKEDLGVDSLDVIDVIIHLERYFDITIQDDDIESFVTLGDLVACIEKLNI